MTMAINSGLSIKDAQHAICKGTYGRKEWSSSQRQTACQRYEELTGIKLESNTQPIDLSFITIFASLLLIVIVAYVFYRHKIIRKRPGN